jgi:putative membrane protein
MSPKLVLSLAFATALAGSASGALAKDSPGQAFMKKAIEGNLAEVQLGQLAQQKGGSDGVKNLGRQLETDHSSANQKAMSVASSMSMTPPSEPDKKQKATYQRLSKLSGDAFDREFVKLSVADHKKDIAEYQKEAKRQNDPAAGYAGETLPSLQNHLEMAQSLQSPPKTQ